MLGGGKKCPRCTKTVYFAERALGPGGDWHKSCLCCIDCNKRLDSTTLAEHDGEAYCKTCHGRRFGPKGYGFSAGAAGLMSTDTARNVNTPVVNKAPNPSITPSGKSATKAKFCSGCGTKAGAGKFCSNCGNQL